MTGAIFTEMLRRNWRSILYWGFGLGGYGLMVTSIIPNVDMLKQYADMLGSMPPAMLSMFGISDAASLGTAEGFLGTAYFVYVIFLMIVYAVMAGLSFTSNEEDQGIMDIMLSLPLPRWRIIVEKAAFYVLAVIAISMCSFIGLFIGGNSNNSPDAAFKIDTTKLLLGSLNIVPATLLMIAATALMATLFRRKNVAMGAAVIFIIVSYLVEYVGRAASSTILAQINVLSFFHYIDNSDVMLHGLNPGNVVLLLVVTVAMIGGTLWFWQRRDVGV